MANLGLARLIELDLQLLDHAFQILIVMHDFFKLLLQEIELSVLDHNRLVSLPLLLVHYFQPILVVVDCLVVLISRD